MGDKSTNKVKEAHIVKKNIGVLYYCKNSPIHILFPVENYESMKDSFALIIFPRQKYDYYSFPGYPIVYC